MKAVKTINLELPYKFDKPKKGAAARLSHTLILVAIKQNHPQGMSAEQMEGLKEILDKFEDKDQVQLTEGEFNKIYREVRDCETFPIEYLFAVPILTAELDRVKFEGNKKEKDAD